jgi:hypothetical protein
VSGVWIFCSNHPGILLVLVGVAGEIVCGWKKSETKRETWEKFFGIMLIVGLVVEIWEAAGQDKEVAQLALKAGRAMERAAMANERASTNEAFAKQLEIQVINTKTELATAQRQLAESLEKRDPAKWPVYSVGADVRLTFNGRMGEDVPIRSRLILSESQNPQARVVLLSDVAVESFEGKSIFVSRGWFTYALHFASPFRPVASPVISPLLLGQTAEYAKDALDGLFLRIDHFPGTNGTVVRGMAVVTLNDIVLRTFTISPGTITNEHGILDGYVNTNAAAKFLDSRQQP